MGLIWIGSEKGMQGFPGIPARNLSDEEMRQRGLDVAFLLETGLYVEEEPKPKKSKKSKKIAITED